MTARDAANDPGTKSAVDPGASAAAPTTTRLEDLRPGASVSGILAAPVTVVSAAWRGSNAVELMYRTADGTPGDQLLFRADEARLAVADDARPWAFDADGQLFQLAAEAARELAYRLYTACERKKRAADALRYNALVQSWPEIARLAGEARQAGEVQASLFGDG